MSENRFGEFLKKYQDNTSLNPELKPGETAVEALKRMEDERIRVMSARPSINGDPQRPASSQSPSPPSTGQTPPAVQEVVFYEGYKLPRDFFTLISLCIIKMNDPKINKIFETFGFSLKDLNGKPVVLKKLKRKKK